MYNRNHGESLNISKSFINNHIHRIQKLKEKKRKTETSQNSKYPHKIKKNKINNIYDGVSILLFSILVE